MKKCRRQTAGFSLTELVVAVAISLVLMAIGLPLFLRAYRVYQLTSAAEQVADILRFARYEAIRLNKPVNCVIQPYANDPTMSEMWIDPNRNGAQDPAAKMILLGNGGNLIAGGAVPGTANLAGSASLGAVAILSPSPAGATVSFDTRGAVIGGNVSAFYLNSPASPDAGYRAVLLMPAGSTQVWTGDNNGNWQQLR